MREKVADFLNLSPEDDYNEIEKAIEIAISELFLESEQQEAEKDKSDSEKMKIIEKPDGKSKMEAHLERLKSYVFKCGVRKVWKKELDGLNMTQSITKVNIILEDLGMEGRPTLQKCKDIKERRDHEKEMEVIDKNNIIISKRRSQTTSGSKDKDIQVDNFDFLSKLGDPNA